MNLVSTRPGPSARFSDSMKMASSGQLRSHSMHALHFAPPDSSRCMPNDIRARSGSTPLVARVALVDRRDRSIRPKIVAMPPTMPFIGRSPMLAASRARSPAVTPILETMATNPATITICMAMSR